MYIIGLTGGIGSGKSLVAKIFIHLGIPVFNADTEAKKILDEDLPVREQLKAWFGPQIYTESGLDRAKLAGIIFTSRDLIIKVNELVHPRVYDRFILWCGSQKDKPYVIHEAAILFESGFYRHMDATILITAPESIRIGRVIQRDKISEEDVRRRMQNQWSDEQKSVLAGYIIQNDGETPLMPKILGIHHKLID